MGNRVEKNIAEQYSKICGLKVNLEKQQQFVNRLLFNLKAKEIKYAKALTPLSEPSVDINKPLIELCSHDLTDELTKNRTALEYFPRVKLAQDIIDLSFEQIRQNDLVPELLKRLVLSLKPAFFRLALEQPASLLADDNPLTSMLDILTSYTPLWKDESQVNYPTFVKLASLVNFSDLSQNELPAIANNTLIEIAKIKSNQEKRSLIFEKRLVERESGVAVTNLAKSIVQQLIERIEVRYHFDSLVDKFLKQTWSKLLSLELIRDDAEPFIDALLLFIELLLSLREITSTQQLNRLIDRLPAIKSGLLEGLEKLAVSELEANDFLTAIEARHLELIKSASKQTLPNEDQEKLEASINVDSSQSPKSAVEHEEIIRLKPNDIFMGSHSDNNLKASEIEISDLEKQPPLEDEPTDSIQTNSLDILQMIEQQINTEADSKLPYAVLFKHLKDQVIGDTHAIENSSLPNELSEYLTLNDWYSIGGSHHLSKLIYINPTSHEHVFVNQLAQKSHALSPSELLDLKQQEQLSKFLSPNIIEPATIKGLAIFKAFIADKKELKKLNKQAEESRKNEALNSLKPISHNTNSISDKINVDEPKVQSDPNEQLRPKEPSPSTDKKVASVELSMITVGSWFEMKIDNKIIKCKLAARIVSKDTYIFVDRKGVKISEVDSKQLQSELSSGNTQLVSSENNNSQLLESVIAKTRNLKAEL